MIKRKMILSSLILLSALFLAPIAYCADSSNLNSTVTINPSDIPPGPTPSPEPGGGSGAGGVVIIAGAGVTAVAAGAGIASFFSGLVPGCILGLAAPICPVIYTQEQIDIIMSNPDLNQYLIKGIHHALSSLKKSNTSAIYVQDQVIMPNSYNITFVNVPNNVNSFNMKILQSSSPLNKGGLAPNPDFRVFKNTNQKELDKIFKTKRFKTPFIKNKEIALIPQENLYNDGLISKAAKIKTGNFSQIAIVTTNTSPKGTPPIRYAYVITFD